MHITYTMHSLGFMCIQDNTHMVLMCIFAKHIWFRHYKQQCLVLYLSLNISLNQTKLWDENHIKLEISPKVEIYEHKALLNILEEENIV